MLKSFHLLFWLLQEPTHVIMKGLTSPFEEILLHPSIIIFKIKSAFQELRESWDKKLFPQTLITD